MNPAISPYLFPLNSLGNYVLGRKRLIDNFFDDLAVQKSEFDENMTGQSIYINGCMGMGKTSLLMLLAKALKDQGYEVYYFSSSSSFPADSQFAIQSLLEEGMSTTKQFAFLIDEVSGKYDSGSMNVLLRGTYSNLVVVGAGVSRDEETGITGKFLSNIGVSDLDIRKTDVDFIKLVEKLQGDNDNPALVSEICGYILDHCGGHVFPTLFLIEYFLVASKRLQIPCFENFDQFIQFFNGSEFSNSRKFHKMKGRCFSLSSSMSVHVSNVLGGVETDADIIALRRLGWWNMDTNQFISALIKNLCLMNIVPRDSIPQIFFNAGMPDENATLAIIEGFKLMEVEDFKCLTNVGRKLPIENALSFKWALCVARRIRNATLRFQESSEHAGYVDFHLNGYSNCAIEFIRNATLAEKKSSRQSTDINAHLERFTSGKYHWKRYFIVNMAMDRRTTLVLPSDARYHDRVFTFVYSTNSLYRGRELICKPAVISLPCPSDS